MPRIAALLLLAFTCFMACLKNNTNNIVVQQQKPPIAIDSILRCYSKTSWDSTTIRTALIGKWQWEFIQCFWQPEKANSEDFKTLVIEFKMNDSLTVYMGNQITQTTSWRVTKQFDGFYKLSTGAFVPQLPGNILLCGNRVVFYDSYVDGCDNFFKK